MSEGSHLILLALVGAALALAAVAFIVWPLIARRSETPGRAAHEVALLKAQIAEIERDLSRQAISDAEAEGARRELGRKLLAADAALAQEQSFKPAPAGVSKRAAAITAATACLGALGVYLLVGAPELPDQPLSERQEFVAFLQDEAEQRFGRLGSADAPTTDAQTPPPQAAAPQAGAETAPRPRPETAPETPPETAQSGQTAAAPPSDARFEELVAATRATLASRPEDHEGRLILASALSSRGRHAEAWPLIQEAIEILGPDAPTTFYAALGETMTLAAGGYVSQEAEAAFRRAPGAPVSRYYLGAAAIQRGAAEEALAIWMWLLEDVRRGVFGETALDDGLEPQIRRLAGEMNLDPDAVIGAVDARVAATGGETTARGPSAEDMQAAAEMSPEDRQAMIQSMVDGLAARLAETPVDLAGWLQLIRAYQVMGRSADRAAALARAREVFAGDAAALAALAQAEAEAAPARPQ